MAGSNANAPAWSRRLSLKLVAGTILLLCLDDGVLAQGGHVDSDKAALEALYDATAGANWTHTTNWKSGQPLTDWFGVTVDGDGRVTRVTLRGNGLTGSIPAAIGDLDKLQQLDLADNALSGTLPSELENLVNLEALRLGQNRALTGPLPSGLSDLSNVDTLTIGSTELCVPDEADFQTWLENISFIGLICPPTTQSTIHLAVFYTSAVREGAGGTDAIETEIDLMVAETNKAYLDGGVNQRVALVAVAEVDYVESDIRTDLARLFSPSDGYMDEVHATRDQFAADIVVLVPRGIGASAYIMRIISTRFDNEAFAAVSANRGKIFRGGVTFAHELGHIMGLRHDRYEECDSNSCSRAAFPYAYGYVNQQAFESGAPTSTRWQSIMAYSTQCADAGFPCSRLLRFSNPDQIHPDPGGDPLGKSGLEPSTAVDGPSDAVRLLNRTRGYVEKFRRAPQITVSFAANQYTATEGGSAANVTVSLSEAPTRPVDVPIVSTGTSDGSIYDFEVPFSVRFGADETERSFTVTAVDDSADEGDESMTVSFGSPLPAGVTAGGTIEATVTLTDNDTEMGDPSVIAVDLTSNPGPNGAYTPTDEIEASVRFNKTVVVTGTPQLELTLGNDSQEAPHNSTTGDVLWFAYPVAEDDSAPDGVAIAANSLSLNGSTIRDSANNVASLIHDAVSADSDHRVDGVKPGLSSAAVDVDVLTLVFNEALDEASVPEAGGTAGAIRVMVGTETRSLTQVAVSGETVTVHLEPQVVHGDSVTLSYTPGTRPIQDLVGNRAESFSGRTVTNDTPMPFYDQDRDGLIGISTLAQLDAIRYDVDGDGVPKASGATKYRDAFSNAFANQDSRLLCGGTGCSGYELLADLDFDTDGSGDPSAGDAYWNGGAGWVPIGNFRDPFVATFQGNGQRVQNLFIKRPSSNQVGLFGVFGDLAIPSASRPVLKGVGVSNINVSGQDKVGGLVGENQGTVLVSYGTGVVSGRNRVGGLVGSNWHQIHVCYAGANVSGTGQVGGLAGYSTAHIIASYATGHVAATDAMSGSGGLVGNADGSYILASYTTGRISGAGRRDGGLIGADTNSISGTVSASYWDKDTSGVASGSLGSGQSTTTLQSPEGYTGIYGNWNADLDGDSLGNDPWHFGGSGDYPALKVNLDGMGTATWEEFGYQLRDRPELTVGSDSGQVMLSWTAVDASAWNPAPTVVYTVIRDDGTDVEAVASGLDALAYTDRDVTGGDSYTYQVAAGIGTGEASRSAIRRITVISSDSTPPSIESIESGGTHPTKNPFTVTITFSESVTDLMADEIDVTNGTGSNFSGSDATYTLRVRPDEDFEGDVTVTVAAGAAKDGSDNTSEAGSGTFAVDTRAPAFVTTDAATVNRATLTLVFHENLALAYGLSSAITVTGATTRTITSAWAIGTAVQLTVSPPVLHGETGIEVDYTAPSQNGLADWVGNKVASFEDRPVSNETPSTTLSTEVSLSLDATTATEGDSAKSVTVTGTLNRSARPTATDVTVEVGTASDTATEGVDYTTVDDLALTIPAYETSATARFTLTPVNDRIDEPDESLGVRGSTAASGLSVTPAGGLSIGITDNDPAPSLALTVDKSSFAEDGGTVTVTVGTGSGSTFETAQTVRLSVAGTATETADYTVSGKTLTLPAGVDTSASTVNATLTGVDDDVDDDGETVVVSATHNGLAFSDRRTVTIEDDDDPEVTVSFSQGEYRVAEGGHVDVAVTLNAVPERQVSIPVEAEGADGADSADFSISPSSLSFGANETTRTVRVSAANDSAVDPGESVALSLGTLLPERISEGGIAETTVAIRDTDFTFAPAFAAGTGTAESDADTYTVSEASSALRLSLTLETPRGARLVDIVDPVVVTLATRENAGNRGMDEDYATERRSGTFGDYGELNRDLSFAPGDFSDDGNCGCATAEKSVSVDLFDDRVHERVEVFGLRLSRQSGRLGVSSKDITAKIAEDDAEPALTLDANPARIAEAGGVSTVTVSTGAGSTFPSAQTIRLELGGTATRGADYTIDSTSLTLPAGAGEDPSTVSTTVRALDDPFDDNAETVALSATRDDVEFASRAVAIADDDIGSTRVDLAVNPAQVREDAGATTVRVTATLDGAARAEDTDVAVTVGASGDSAVEGTDYATVPDLTLTIDAGETMAETTFRLAPTNNDSVEGAKTITVDGSVPGLAVRSADLTLNDDDVESTTVTLTLDPLEVRESAGSRTVRVTGTLDGGARPTATVVAVTVGSGGDTAAEGTDYQDVGDLELTIPANRTDGTVTFTLRPTNDRTAEGTETISVRGDVAGLTVTPTELALADDDTASTRLDLSLNPSTVSEAAAPTEVAVTASLDAGARTSDTVVTVTVGAFTDTAAEGLDYANVSVLQLTVPANETAGQTMFMLSPDNDAIAEGAETISVTGRVSGLTVEPATLTLSDNDTASRVVTLSVNPESVSEDTPENVTVTASLNAGARAENTQVRLTVGAAGDTAVPGTDYERVSERTLTILSGETGGTATFLLEPLDNDSADGARTLSVTGSTTVAELRIEPATGAKVALEDDDDPAVLVMPEALTVVEAGSARYAVTLQTRPTADVTVTITGVSGDLSLDRTSLVFTQADWRDPQDVTVTAADDADSVQDPDVTLTHRASGAAEYWSLRTDLVVTIRENDPSLVFSETALRVPEGETATYAVALATVPTADVTVRITGVSGDLSLDKTELAYTPGDWDDAQTITVEAAQDDDTSTDAAVTLTHRASGGGYDGIAGTVRVTIAEDDRGGGTGGGSGGGGPRNGPPVATAPLGAQVLEPGGSVRIDATAHFRDPERRTMTFEAESADSAVATVEVDDGAVTVRAVDHGATAVTVTAVDDRRARATQSFEVTVGRLVSFASEEVSAPEGGTATLTVVINRPRDVATSLDYVVGPDDDPATADADAADHDGVGGTVVIAAQAMEATIALAVHDDTDIEPPRETFAVTLQATEAQLQDFGLGIATVRVTIEEGVCDRTQQVRNALRRSLPCAAVSATDLGGRRDLDLANTGLAALRGTDLSDLSGLAVLDLSGNALTSLPAGLFAGLGALGEVRLQDNPGAPFVLRLALLRTDGEPWAPGPAAVVARVREGAPFALRAALSAVNGTLSAATALVPAGMTAGAPMAVVQDAAGATRVTAAAPAVPDTRCGVLGTYPCFQGIATTAGGTLVLFKAPPEVTDTPSRTTLAAEGDAARLDLSALFAAADGGALTYFAGSSDPTLAAASVAGDTLTLASNEDGREGAVTVTVTATDEDGLSVTLTFEVTVEAMPRGLLRGWRRVLLEQAMERRAAEVE